MGACLGELQGDNVEMSEEPNTQELPARASVMGGESAPLAIVDPGTDVVAKAARTPRLGTAKQFSSGKLTGGREKIRQC